MSRLWLIFLLGLGPVLFYMGMRRYRSSRWRKVPPSLSTHEQDTLQRRPAQTLPLPKNDIPSPFNCVLNLVLNLCHRADHGFIFTCEGPDIVLVAVQEKNGTIDMPPGTRFPGAKGILGWIAREKRIVSISDLHPDEDFFNNDAVKRARSFLSVPIGDPEIHSSMLCVDSAEVAAFGEADIQRLEWIADMARIILDYHQQQKQTDQLTRIHTVILAASQNLTSRVSVREILDRTITLAEKIIAYDLCFAFGIEPGEHQITVLATEGTTPEIIGTRFTLTEGLLHQMVKTQRALIFSNPAEAGESDPRIFPASSPLSTTARSFIGLPMIFEDTVLAILLFGSHQEQTYTQEHQKMLAILCNTASSALMESQMRTRLELLSITDDLTGVANHRRFQERLTEECARAQRHPISFSLLLLDLDFFKKINDGYGHLAGDEVLKTIASVMAKQVRLNDLVARYGGEEFAVVLTQTNSKQAYRMAERIRTAVEATHVQWEEHWISMTVSIGIATFLEDTTHRETLMRCADTALYRSKQNGRNCSTRYS